MKAIEGGLEPERDRARGSGGEKAMQWQFGRGKPRLRGLSLAATAERRITLVKGAEKKAVATWV